MTGATQQSESRWLSAAEFALGALIVVGHNVYHAVPNEVPILFVLGLLSFRLREGSWAAMGLARPTSWVRTVVLALGPQQPELFWASWLSRPRLRDSGLQLPKQEYSPRWQAISSRPY
jgi:hypothetical protein